MTDSTRSAYRKKTRESENLRMRQYMDRIRDEVRQLLGGACARCGNDDHRVLQVDHVDGGGNEERRAARSFRKRMLVVIEKSGTGYQLFFANCHMIKQWEQRNIY